MNSSTKILFPSSLDYYRKNKDAVDAVISSNNIPPDLLLDKAEEYHNARLASLKIQTDYWILLRNIYKYCWEATFLNSGLLVSKDITIKELTKYTASCEVKDVWEECGLIGFLQLSKEQEVYIAVELHHKENSTQYIKLAAGGDDTNLHAQDICKKACQNSSGNWPLDPDEDSWTYSREFNLNELGVSENVPKEGSQIEIQPLINAVQEIVSSVRELSQ